MKKLDGDIWHYIAIYALLQLAFVIFRLTGIIKWDWIWVLVPLWAPMAAIGFLGILAVIFFVFIWILWWRE